VQISIIINESAFKHGVGEPDIQSAFSAFLLDCAIDGDENKYLVIGFDTKGNLIELMNIISTFFTQ